MIIIGEKLNTSIDEVGKAVQDSDIDAIEQIALSQVKAGADYIDVNCGTFVDREPELLKWMVTVLGECTHKPLCIDSPNPQAIGAALKVYGGHKPIINSITGQKRRYDSILPLVLEYGTSVIALCMDDDGIPGSADARVSVAERLVENLTNDGVDFEDIFIDPLVQPMAMDQTNGLTTLRTIEGIKKSLPGIKTLCGLSNISFGLPDRSSINKAFLVLAIHKGLDAAILDPLDRGIVSLSYAAKLMGGQDEYCLNYLESIKSLKEE
ncbi:MAG TPA: dihydropteroate synthase [Clostridia bacterium]|nr:dihydropteroate synthase [Clostridia bacterium]